MEKNYNVVFAAQKVVKMEECPMPTMPLEPHTILVKSDVSLISTGTELSVLEREVEPDSAWATQRTNYPIVPGYSNCGTILAVGPEVDPNLVGRRVMTGATHKLYYTIGMPRCVVLPDNVDPDESTFASLAGVSLASIRVAGILPGDAVVVYGAGLVGQLAARFAKVAGALKVFVVDLSEYRLNLLPDDPCFIKVNPAGIDVPEFIKEHNDGNLARVVFETTGNQKVIPSELYCITKRGKLIITSSPRGKSAIDFDYVSTQGITIIGAHNFAAHSPVATPANPWTVNSEKPYFIEMLAKEQMSVKNLISHRYNYKDAPDAYNMLMADRGSAMAVLIDWKD